MNIEINNIIIGIITHEKNQVQGSGTAPVFYSSGIEESEKMALTIAKVTGGMVHSLENGVYMVVKH